jgi:hypothetical protein
MHAVVCADSLGPGTHCCCVARRTADTRSPWVDAPGYTISFGSSSSSEEMEQALVHLRVSLASFSQMDAEEIAAHLPDLVRLTDIVLIRPPPCPV